MNHWSRSHSNHFSGNWFLEDHELTLHCAGASSVVPKFVLKFFTSVMAKDIASDAVDLGFHFQAGQI